MYRPFHKTLPKSSLRIHWISARFYHGTRMGFMKWAIYKPYTYLTHHNFLVVGSKKLQMPGKKGKFIALTTRQQIKKDAMLTIKLAQ